MIQKSLAQNTTFLTLALALQKALSFVYFIFVARIMGVDNTGKYAFALSFVTIFAMFLDFGLNQVLIRESARDSRISQQYLSNVLGLKVIGSVIIYLVIILMVNVLGYPSVTVQMVYIAGIVMIIDSFANSFFSVLRGHHNLIYESVGVVVNQALVLGCGLTVLFLGWGLVPLIAVYLIGSLFNFSYSIISLKRKLKIGMRITYDWSIIKKILTLALPFGLAGIFIRLYSSMDVVLLSKLSSDTAVGLYSAAYKITFALQFVAVAFSASVYPTFCRLFVENKEQLGFAFSRSLRYLAIIAMPIAVGTITIADVIMGPLFGWQYQAAVPALQIMMSVLILIFWYFPIGAVLNATNRQSQNTLNLAVVAGSNIILNLILIPRLDYVGAAVSVVLSYILLYTLGIMVVDKVIDYDRKYIWLSLFRITLSCLVMAGVVLLVKDQLHFVLTILIGAIVYPLMIALLREFTFKDFKVVKSLILKKS